MGKKLGILIIGVLMSISLMGCGAIDMAATNLKGSITGNSYTIDCFDDYGKLKVQMHGEQIGIEGVYNEVHGYSREGTTTSYELSSVINLTIDGTEALSCGNTLIFYEDGLTPDVNFELQERIDSESESLTDVVAIAGAVNKVKNMIGKPKVVLIQSELGQPIYAFSGNKVTVNVPDNLPKFTKLSVDGKALYIHRCDYMILDKELLR